MAWSKLKSPLTLLLLTAVTLSATAYKSSAGGHAKGNLILHSLGYREVEEQIPADLPLWTMTNGPDGGIVRAFARNHHTGTLLVGAPNAGIFRSTNGGKQWHKSNSGIGMANFIFHIETDPNQREVVYAVFVNGGAFRSSDDGKTWSPINNGLADEKPYSIAVDPSDSRVLYLGTQDGRVFKSIDEGASWIRQSSGLPTGMLFSISDIVVDSNEPGTVYASTGWWDDSPGIGIFKSSNGGENWGLINNGLGSVPTFSTLAMNPRNHQTLFAAGTLNFGGPPESGDYGIYKTENGGTSWRRVLGLPQTASSGQSVSVVVSPNNPDVVYAGVGKDIFKSLDNGETWERLPAVPPIPIVTHLIADDAGTFYVTGYYGGVSISTDGGFSWVYSTLGFNATRIYGLAVDPSDPNVAYAGTRGDGQFKTTDGGRTWRRFEMGLDFFGGASWAIDPQIPDVVYAGTYYSFPGRIYKTTDAGKKWKKVLDTGQTESFSEQRFVNSIVIDPSDRSTVYAAVLESGVFKSTDAGESWRQVNAGLGSLYVTALAIHPQNDLLYVGTLEGGVFKSTDGGEHWAAANVGLTDTDVWSLAIDPKNPDTLYAGTGSPESAISGRSPVPSRAGYIFKSTDAGESWFLVATSPTMSSIWSMMVDPSDSSVVYAASGRILTSDDGGLQWVQGGRLIYDMDNDTEPPYVRSLAMDSRGNTLYAGTIEGGVFRAALRPASGVRLVSTSGQWTEPGATATITFVLRNTGNYPDTFSLATRLGQGWNSSVQEFVSLDIGEDCTIPADVTVPPSSSVGLTDTLVLTATSRNDPGVSSAAESVITVVGPEPLATGVVVDEIGEPMADATVRVRATDNTVLSDPAGRFRILGVYGSVELTASKPDYYIASTRAMKGQQDVRLQLRPLFRKDETDYRWLSYRPGWMLPGNCGNCHDPIVRDWLSDSHSKSASNFRFFNVYDGTDATGRQGVQPGLKLDLSGGAGNCAFCHAPMAPALPAPADMDSLSGTEKEGINCDFCHKIYDVFLDAGTRVPDPGKPGILSIQLLRPSSPEQVFFGPLDDVPDPDSFLPLQGKSAFCAPCHSGTFANTRVYESYPEWLASAYSRQGVECQDCHMPRTGITNVAPGQGGLERAPETLHGHYMPGASDLGLLRSALTLDVSATLSGQGLRVDVVLTNSGAGHHIPTDHPMRNMLLAVTAQDNLGRPLGYTGKNHIPSWGGTYSGMPGKGYAKILADQSTGEAPVVSYWKPTVVQSDTRLPALSTDNSIYEFMVPSGVEQVQIQVQVIFRRSFEPLAMVKGWEIQDILIAEKTLILPISYGPDLKVEWESLDKVCKNTSKGTKCKVMGTLNIQNIGSADDASSFVRFYVSDDENYDEDVDTFLKQVATGTVKTGSSKLRKLSYSFQSGESVSGKYIIAVIDADNTILEIDETNNVSPSGPIP